MALAEAEAPDSTIKADHSERNQVLIDLQKTLQLRYDVAVPDRVDEFISHDADFLQRMTGTDDNPPEMLLVREHGEDLDITLFLDESLLQSIDQQFWNNNWSAENFSNYCPIIEGVSHFLYLVWNARHGRAVKLIELELQAEVDKFVFAAVHTACDQPSEDTDNPTHQSMEKLLERLFRDVSFRENLAPEALQRYESANALACVYCEWLASRFAMSAPDRALATELARFYRMKTAAKITHITEHLH